MGISLALCGGWTTPCSLMLPTLHLCGQLSFGLPLSPSSSFLLSNKTGVTKMKESFNKLAELGLNESLLKPFYCHSKTWMKPLQSKAQWLPVSLSKLLLSLCLPQLFYFDGLCLHLYHYVWVFGYGGVFFVSAALHYYLVLTDYVEHTTLVILMLKSEWLPVDQKGHSSPTTAKRPK